MAGSTPIDLKTRVTLAMVVVFAPLFVWAGKQESRIQRLEEERVEMRQELRDMNRKLDDIRERIPARHLVP